MLIELKQAPEVRRIVIAAFPSYRKYKSFLSEFPARGMTINSYWDGGSKDEYAIVDMATGKSKAFPNSTHPYFDVAAKGMANRETPDIESDAMGAIWLKHLPEGYALVSAGTFCGKAATAHVYVNNNNLTKLLPEDNNGIR